MMDNWTGEPNMYHLTEAQMQASSHDKLVEYTLGLQHTANVLVERLEQVSALIDNGTARDGMAHRLYSLERVVTPDRLPGGALRLATAADTGPTGIGPPGQTANVRSGVRS